MKSKWPKKTFRETLNDVFAKEKFKPSARTKIMLSLLIRIFQTRLVDHDRVKMAFKNVQGGSE